MCGAAEFVPLPAGEEGALAMGTGSGVLVELVAGVDWLGICVVAGAVIIGSCCCCAVGCGCANTTGPRPL